MENLEKILNTEPSPIPEFTLDNFQLEIQDNIHLEFFFQNCRFLITPQFGFLTTGTATPEEENSLINILENHQPRLEKWKEYLLYNLSLYSALLETNSYYIALNEHTLIARFIPLGENPSVFEIKIYTISRNDLIDNYKDKIYLGRDFLSLETLQRPHFGIRNICESLEKQLRKLRTRLSDTVPAQKNDEIEQEYIAEIEELLVDFEQSIGDIERSTPPALVDYSNDVNLFIQSNALFRDKKHILIEIEGTIRELEQFMFQEELSRPVRYVTKFRKDVTNYINYITFKINGRLSDYINKIHF